MTKKVTFRPFLPTDKGACLELFDANCPEFFAPQERTEYENFLEANPDTYELCIGEGSVVGAFGLMGDHTDDRKLNWILLDPASQGLGIGAKIMERVILVAGEAGVRIVTIAASHKSAPFFAKFGSHEVAVTADGWGPGMHRVDMELPL